MTGGGKHQKENENSDQKENKREGCQGAAGGQPWETCPALSDPASPRPIGRAFPAPAASHPNLPALQYTRHDPAGAPGLPSGRVPGSCRPRQHRGEGATCRARGQVGASPPATLRASTAPRQRGGRDTRGAATCRVQERGWEKGGLVCSPPARLFGAVADVPLLSNSITKRPLSSSLIAGNFPIRGKKKPYLQWPAESTAPSRDRASTFSTCLQDCTLDQQLFCSPPSANPSGRPTASRLPWAPPCAAKTMG